MVIILGWYLQACLGVDNKSWNEMKGGFSGLGLSYDM